MVFIAEKPDVVGLVVEIALITQVEAHAACAEAEAGGPAPGKLIETRFVAVDVGKFRAAVEVVVTHRTTVKQKRTDFKTDHERHVEVVVRFVLDQLFNTGFLDAVIGPAGIEHEFGLEIDAFAKTDITSELVTYVGVFKTENEG